MDRQNSRSKAHIASHQANQVHFNRQQQQPYEMWSINPSNGNYYFNPMPIVNSFAQHYSQNPSFLSSPSASMQSTYPTQMQYYYYNREQQQPVNEMRNFQQGQLLSQGQRQGQGQGQRQGQGQMWYHLPQQNYNYYSAMQQQSVENPYIMAQMKPQMNVARNTTQSFQQTATKPPEMQSSATQSMNIPAQQSSYPLRPRTTTSGQQGHSYIPHVSSGNGKLNRIDSVTSFKNLNGSRIRNSQHDLVEYRRIAARTLCEKEQNEEEELKKQFQKRQDVINERIRKSSKSVSHNMITKEPQSTIELTKQSQSINNDGITESDSEFQVVVLDETQANKRRIKSRKTNKSSMVIKEPVSARGSSFFQKLGLFKGGNKKHSFFSMLHRHPKATTIEPGCSTDRSLQDSEYTSKSGKKTNIVKRFFSDDHYPRN